MAFAFFLYDYDTLKTTLYTTPLLSYEIEFAGKFIKFRLSGAILIHSNIEFIHISFIYQY